MTLYGYKEEGLFCMAVHKFIRACDDRGIKGRPWTRIENNLSF
jgi:hypothetical protein